jgi:hypothetical protein
MASLVVRLGLICALLSASALRADDAELRTLISELEAALGAAPCPAGEAEPGEKWQKCLAKLQALNADFLRLDPRFPYQPPRSLSSEEPAPSVLDEAPGH